MARTKNVLEKKGKVCSATTGYSYSRRASAIILTREKIKNFLDRQEMSPLNKHRERLQYVLAKAPKTTRQEENPFTAP